MVPPNATKSWRRAAPNTPEPATLHPLQPHCTNPLQPHCTLYSPTAPTLYSPTTVLLLQPYSTTLYSPTAPTLYSPTTVLLLQPYSITLYSPTASTLYSPTTVLLLQPYSTTLYSPTAPTLCSPTPTTLLHKPLQSHRTNRDPLQQHPNHESPDGRGMQVRRITYFTVSWSQKSAMLRQVTKSMTATANPNEDQPSHLPTCAPPGYSSF
ncbi:hypothetical protein ACOMHN_029251 [Nucella lapillus]